MQTTNKNEVYDLGADLIEAATEMVAIESGEATPAVQRVYVGSVLVERREGGRTVWSLADAGQPPPEGLPDLADLRERLCQTQVGIAELLGVSVKTWRNWEQGERTPRGPAQTLLRVVASDPSALLTLWGTAAAVDSEGPDATSQTGAQREAQLNDRSQLAC